ncbi:hypothetical protein [Roseococcus sp. SYP-B2431]|uniref:hypothetical protein n=1 Tax=Roseococcus sp. SYP-B2431 TaxID=2496640 RepID=UPI0013F48C34|nr:hypothetical protein [Roseococcus sp. SYP-B2431]
MRLSNPIIEDGALVAVAAQGDAGWFLIAIDRRLEELDRANFQSASAAEQAARGYLRRNHPPTGAWRTVEMTGAVPSTGKPAHLSAGRAAPTAGDAA